MILKINRVSVETPNIHYLSYLSNTPDQSGGFESLSKDEQVAYLVNKGLDGDMDSVNKADNKVIRAKAKAMIVKINRGSVERPPMPELADVKPANYTAPSRNEAEEE